MSIKYSITFSLLALFISATAVTARNINYLQDSDFEGFTTKTKSNWFCSRKNNITGIIKRCRKDKDYVANVVDGIRLGRVGYNVAIAQQPRSFAQDDYAAVQLEFDYKFKHSGDDDGDLFEVFHLQQYSWQPTLLWSSPIESTTTWQHASVDLKPYVDGGQPVWDFFVKNNATNLSTVSLRHVRIKVHPYPFLVASFVDENNTSLTEGQLTLADTKTSSALYGGNLSPTGTTFFLQLNGRNRPYVFRLVYQGEVYYTKKRLHNGEQHHYTFQLDQINHRLKVIEQEVK